MPSANIDAEPEKAAAMNFVMAMPTFARSAAMIARVEPSVLICSNLSHGDVSERPKVLVSKTSVRESAPRVQIPPSPPEILNDPNFRGHFFVCAELCSKPFHFLNLTNSMSGPVGSVLQ